MAELETADLGHPNTQKTTLSDRVRTVRHTFLTRDGLLGDYSYRFLFTPQLPFMAAAKQASPFFGLNEKMPVVLALVLGFQHALAMLAGIVRILTPMTPHKTDWLGRR